MNVKGGTLAYRRRTGVYRKVRAVFREVAGTDRCMGRYRNYTSHTGRTGHYHGEAREI